MCILTLFDHLPLPVRRAARTFTRLLRSGEASAMLAVLLTLLATLFPSAFPALAENGLSWSWDSEYNELYISGSGTIDQSFWNDSNLPPKGNISYVSIGEGITAIGSNTFSGCGSLAEVWIHWTGTPLTLGPGAFDGTPVINKGVRINNNSKYLDALLLIDPQNSGYRYTTGEEVNFWLISTGTTASAVLKLGYTVTWLDEDGKTVLDSGLVGIGEKPAYSGTPTKVPDEQYNYVFKKWDPEPIAVTGDQTYTATYEKSLRTYKITWLDGDGKTLKTDDLPYGATLSYSGNTPTKTADAQYTYTFAGWSPAITTVTGNAEYTAQFTPTLRQYTITFKNYDGSELLSVNVDYGKTPEYTKSAPTRNPDAQYTYTFAGWSPAITKVTGNAEYIATYTAAENISEENTNTVTYDGNGGEIREGRKTQVSYPYASGSETKVLANQFDRIGYSFAGWNTSPNGGGTGYNAEDPITVDKDITLYAQWTPNTYTVRYDANGGTGSMADQNFIWGTQQNLTANTFTRIGYTFTKWNTDPNGIGTSYPDGKLTGDLSSEHNGVVILYAQWTPNTYTVRFDANGGTGSMADQEFTYDEAQKLKAIAYTQTGFSFEGWNTNKDGSGTFYKDQDEVSNLSTGGNVTLFAQWTPYSQPTTCNVKVTSSGNGYAYASVTSGKTWDVVKLTAIPAEGYFFSRWEVISGGVVVTNNQFTIGTSDVEIIAIFSQQRTYKVTVLTEGWGVVRVKPPKDYFNSGEVVELFPDATEGWEFAEWRGAKVTKNQFTVGTSDVWITAVFRRKQTNKLRTDFIYVLADGNKGIPPDINAALWEDLTIQLLDKDNNTVAESKYFTLDIKSENSYTVTMEDLEYYGSLTEQDLAPGKYAVSISGLPETMDDKWGNPNPGRPRYKIESDAEINEKDGCMVVTVYIYFYDNPEISVDAPKPQPSLPEDSTGAYYFDEDGIMKYALYQTYLDCMRGLGQDELCRSHERCYHK